MDERLTVEEESLLESALIEAHENQSIDKEEQEENKLPENSPTLLVHEENARFSSATWFNKIQEYNILLVGIGGIGSHVAYLISRLNPNSITIYDNDTVEEHNLSGQLYSTDDVGNYKTYGIARFVSRYSKYSRVVLLHQYYELGSKENNIVICGLDNMSSRMMCFNKWKHYLQEFPKKKKESLFIDGRLNAEEFQIFCMRGTDTYLIDKYEKEWLFEDKYAEETICSYKQTSYCAAMIASYITNLLVNFITNLCNPVIDRELPFFTRYDATNMNFKIE